MTTSNVVLDPQRRGTEFKYSSDLESPWTNTMFDGGIKFTLRLNIPPSTVVSDADKGVVYQTSVAGGGIVFTSATAFVVTIPARVTTKWPLEWLYWDMQGTITAVPDVRVLDIAAGKVLIVGDVTRSQ